MTFESFELVEVVDFGEVFLIGVLLDVGGEGGERVLPEGEMESGGVPFSDNGI